MKKLCFLLLVSVLTLAGIRAAFGAPVRVKELVEVQDGTVSVTSVENAGTTFTVRLPCFRPDASPATPAPDDPAAPTPAAASAPGGTVSNEEWLANLYRRAELFPSMTSVQESVRPMESLRNGASPKARLCSAR